MYTVSFGDDFEYQLMRDILRTYDPRIRPSLNSTIALNVTFGLALAQIIDVVSFGLAFTHDYRRGEFWTGPRPDYRRDKFGDWPSPR